MATEFSREFFADNRIVKAELRSARKPREEELNRIRAEVRKLYDATEVILNVTVDESLLSGYVLQVGDRVFDNSGRHQLDKMMEGKPSLATLKTRIEDYKPAETSAEGGVVISSADGIVHVEGMNRAVYGEIVTFDNGAKGMVESVDPEQLGIMLFDGAETVGVGTMVTRSGKRAGIPVGDAFLGRVISPLGEPIDGKGPIEAVGYNPIEKQAPGILERQSVDTPLHTGILAIDSMFPIGRGQRELIIGDRQTGKTSIATDAILNQKNTGVLCIYVAIGQKASSIARVAGDLQKHGAMSYTTIVAATASDSAPLQYIAPYAGTALAEYFMSQGKSVLIVYDDLSKHAVAYRAISLLLRRSPGREAYPGDVFYLHSRLLERSCRMRDDLGGGSITALPIVETQAGDVSATSPPTSFPSPMVRSSSRAPCSMQQPPGRQCGSVGVPCGRRCPDQGHEEGQRQPAYRAGTVQGYGVLCTVQLGSGRGDPPPAGSRQGSDGNAQAAAVSAQVRRRAGGHAGAGFPRCAGRTAHCRAARQNFRICASVPRGCVRYDG